MDPATHLKLTITAITRYCTIHNYTYSSTSLDIDRQTGFMAHFQDKLGKQEPKWILDF